MGQVVAKGEGTGREQTRQDGRGRTGQDERIRDETRGSR